MILLYVLVTAEFDNFDKAELVAINLKRHYPSAQKIYIKSNKTIKRDMIYSNDIKNSTETDDNIYRLLNPNMDYDTFPTYNIYTKETDMYQGDSREPYLSTKSYIEVIIDNEMADNVSRFLISNGGLKVRIK